MQATKAPAHRERVNRTIAALHFIATTFVMYAMVGRRTRQFKMPRPDAYGADACQLWQRGNKR
jgi:hypothetical protein